MAGNYRYLDFISIHAPREGGDTIRDTVRDFRKDFNPRPPRGGRPKTGLCGIVTFRFQSTPPARGATEEIDRVVKLFAISIHAPREGGDLHDPETLQEEFISIHAPREGGDDTAADKLAAEIISIHAPREGGDSKDAQFYL